MHAPSKGHRFGPSGAASALLGLAVLLAPAICRADDAQELELAKNRFDAGQYDEAHARFVVLLDAALPACDHGPRGSCRITDPDLLERARALDAASLIAQKRIPEAEARIETILRANPTYVPNAALFPQEVVDRFTEVRGRLRDELSKDATDRAAKELKARLAEQQSKEAEERWIDELERLAGKERVVEKHSRWIAVVPFGVGQFQNGDTALGVLFGATEFLLSATAVTSSLVITNFDHLKQQPGCIKTTSCLDALGQATIVARTVNQITFGAWIGATIIGIVQAEIGFVPEKVVMRPRTTPPRPKVIPSVSVLPGGAGFGLVGQF